MVQIIALSTRAPPSAMAATALYLYAKILNKSCTYKIGNYSMLTNITIMIKLVEKVLFWFTKYHLKMFSLFLDGVFKYKLIQS
jgi:hypothetical protein